MPPATSSHSSPMWAALHTRRIVYFFCQFAALFIVCTDSLAGENGELPWIRNLDEGHRAAQNSGKDLLIVFTGHGWCGHCGILDREVFQQAEFIEATRDQFVFVELDFTFGDSAEEESRKAQYEELAEQFLIGGYPTVILADSNLRPFAHFLGYVDGYGPERYLRRIQSAQNAYRDFAKSRKMESSEGNGTEGTEALAKALSEVATHWDVDEYEDDPWLHFYTEEVARVLAELPETNQYRQPIALRSEKQLIHRQREALWEPIASRLDPYYSEKDWSQAAEYIQQTLPTLTDRYVRLRLELRYMNILDQDKQYAKALKLARKIQDHSDLDDERRRRLGNTESRLLLKMGRVDEAIARFDERIAAAEESGDKAQKSWLLSWKAQLMLSTDRLAETIAVCRASRDAAEPGSNDWITATFLLALKLRERGDFNEALRLFREQFDAEPHGQVMLDIAASLIGMNRFDDALEWVKKAEGEVARLTTSPRIDDREFAERIANRVATLREKLPSKN